MTMKLKLSLFSLAAITLFASSSIASARTIRDSKPKEPSTIDTGNPQLVAPSKPDHDFYCGKGLVPCDETFKDFCSKIAGGNYEDLPSGDGACITPGGHNPDPY